MSALHPFGRLPLSVEVHGRPPPLQVPGTSEQARAAPVSAVCGRAIGQGVTVDEVGHEGIKLEGRECSLFLGGIAVDHVAYSAALGSLC